MDELGCVFDCPLLELGPKKFAIFKNDNGKRPMVWGACCFGITGLLNNVPIVRLERVKDQSPSTQLERVRKTTHSVNHDEFFLGSKGWVLRGFQIEIDDSSCRGMLKVY
jgi:hypothetical protein